MNQDFRHKHNFDQVTGWLADLARMAKSYHASLVREGFDDAAALALTQTFTGAFVDSVLQEKEVKDDL
jgi:hypothetical protein